MLVDVQPTLTIAGGLCKNGTSGSSKQRRNASIKGRNAGNILKFFFLNFGDFCCGQNINERKQSGRIGLFLESSLFYVGSICQQGTHSHDLSCKCIARKKVSLQVCPFQPISFRAVALSLLR